MAYGAYSIVILDEAGSPLGDPIERMANSGHPDVGHKVWVDGVLYEVVEVYHEEDPDARASVPYSMARVCVRRVPEPATPPGGRPSQSNKFQDVPASPCAADHLEALDGDLDPASASDIASRNRDIATDLGDLADELALAINLGQSGTLDHSIVDRLHDASRRAKRASIKTLADSKFGRNR